MPDKLVKHRKVLIILFGILIFLVLIPTFIFIFSKNNQLEYIIDRESKAKLVIPQDAKYVPDRLLVTYKEGFSPDSVEETSPDIKRVFDKAGVISQELLHSSTSTTYIVSLKKDTNIKEAGKTLATLDVVEGIEADLIMSIFITPTDSYFQQYQWNLRKIKMNEAWELSTGSPVVKVAVVDTGIDYNHEDLSNLIEKGPDYINNDNDPMDDFGHGTHVAGIIGALTNNAKGISGINWTVKLMAIKSIGNNGTGPVSAITRGVQYAADNGAKVINLSLGAPGICSDVMQSSINYALESDAMVIVAAGNDNSDAILFSPANCQNVLAVGATTETDNRSNFSNFGSVVDISAPGSNILSAASSVCDPQMCMRRVGNKYILASGTSMASPHVAGVAALLFTKSDITLSEVEGCILDSVDEISTDKPLGTGRLNSLKTLQACSISPTSVPSVTPGTGTSLNFQNIKLHGIGRGGDNANPISNGNMSPLHTTRGISVTLTDASNSALPSIQSNVVFDATSGTFKNDILLESVPSGLYRINLRIPQYLGKTLDGIFSITSGQEVIVNEVSLTTGDINSDNFINAVDYNLLLDCISNLTPPRDCSDQQKKAMADLTDDGAVNQFDYNLFLRDLSVQNGE